MSDAPERLKILHVCETSGTGGAETVLRNIVINLDKSCFDSEIVLFRDGWLKERLEKDGRLVRVLPSSGSSFDLGTIRALRRLIKRSDVVHSHLPDANAYSCIAAVLTGVPVVATYHGNIDSSGAKSGTGRLKLKMVSSMATRVVAVSRFLVDTYLAPAGFSTKKLRVVYNGVDFARPASSTAAKSKRAELGFGEDVVLVGMLANLRPAKGYEYFVRACGLIAHSFKSAHYLIIGHERESVKAPMMDLIDELGIGDRVHFLGFREDASEILACLNVFMLSSVTEGLSIATIEAMAARIPVVVTRSGGPEEIVSDGETGFLADVKNPEMLAEKAIRLLGDRHLAERLANNAYESVRSKFELHRMIRSYEDIYREVARK